MDNAYQQKLQERAQALAKIAHQTAYNYGCGPDHEQEWGDDKEHWTEMHKPLAALTLKWSAGDVRQALYDHSVSTGDTSRTDYIRSKGFIPPKTDNNETEKD